ncbi:MAG: YceI family protein [Alphaproteobacteria bacterium]|nr:YceI family protein [Alphaproteobacteria bacterium]
MSAAIAMVHGLPVALSAPAWTVDYAVSRLEFEVAVQGNPLRGQFTAFEASIRFDPKAPETGKIEVLVDLASLSTGNAQTGMTARSAAWLAAREFRFAKFTSTRIQAPRPNVFIAEGGLSIKKMVVPVKIDFTLSSAGTGAAKAEGRVSLDRGLFGIGPPQSSTTPVGNHVVVTFNLTARAEP